MIPKIKQIQKELRLNIFATIRGRSYPSWISGRGPSVGALIEHPAHILESILRDMLTITQINTDSIDEVYGFRPGWKFRRSLTQQTSSLDVVREIAYESGAVLVHDHANLERFVALDNYGPSVALNMSDVVEEEGGQPMARVRQTHVKHIRNEFFLNYGFNYGTGRYNKQLFITAEETNLGSNIRNDKTPFNTYTGLCAQSQQMYNTRQPWNYDAQWIEDHATAEMYIKLMADWLAIRKWEIGVTLWYSPKTRQLEVMDQVLWDLDLLPVSVRNVNVTGLEAVGAAGGTLGAGTYGYLVTGVDMHGETKSSAQITAAIDGATEQSVQVSWAALSGVTKYRIYGRTPGEQDRYWETTLTTFLDTGQAGTTGVAPSAASGYFVTRVMIDPETDRLQIEFMLCPMIFFLAEGYGYRYGELYGVAL